MLLKIIILILSINAIKASDGDDIQHFKDSRIIKTNCSDLRKDSIVSILECLDDPSKIVYCDFGEIIVQSIDGGYFCQKSDGPVFYNLNKTEFRANPVKFNIRTNKIVQFAVLEGNSSELCSEQKCSLKDLPIKNLKEIRILLAVVSYEKNSKNLNAYHTLFVLPTKVSTQCEIDYIRFVDHILSTPKAWKITEVIVECLFLLFILLVLGIFIIVSELRTTITGKCVISYCFAHILHFALFYILQAISGESIFLSFIVMSLELSKYAWINLLCFHKFKMMG